MNSGNSSERSGDDGGSARTKARRRRTLDEVFGDDLPDRAREDRDESHNNDLADWYRRNRPPHYE